MRWLIILLAAFFAQAASLSATPQESDTLIHKGAAHSVLGFRFAPDLNKKLYELARQDERWIVQSSLWRGYTAVLQIRENKLYLMGINLNCHEPKPTSKEILGYEIPDNGVWADFFTGEIYYGFGEHWGYMHNSAWGDQPKKLRKYLFEDVS